MNVPLTIYAALVVMMLSLNMAVHIYSARMPTQTRPATEAELEELSSFLAMRDASAVWVAR